MPVRTKLAIWFSLLVGAILILLAVARYAGQRELLLDQIDYSLKVGASILDASLRRNVSSEAVVQDIVKFIANHPEIELRGIVVKVLDASRSVLFSSSITEKGQFPIPEEDWRKAYNGEVVFSTLSPLGNGTPIRVLLQPVFHENDIVYFILLANSTVGIERTLKNFVYLNMIFIPMTILLLGVGGWILTRRALKPLDELVKSAYRIGSGDLNHRIEIPPMGQEIRELAGAFNQMIQRLETSFQQIQQFSENVSHELRIPLAILKGGTELSLRRDRKPDDYRKVLESNLEEIVRMEKMVEKLLFLSKADRGEIRLEHVQVDLGSLIENVYPQFQHQASEKKVRLQLDLRPGGMVQGDEVLLREVLLNLVQNAIHATFEGGEVNISLRPTLDQLILQVEDTGCGISESDIPHIFKRFYKADKSQDSQGSGLGLSICRWIVEAHKGTLSVKSHYGKGSRFTVCLPKFPPSRH